MAVIYTPHFVQFFDSNGNPLSGGKLYSYEAGTTNPKATYTDASGTTENTNPVILDSAGRAVIFIDGSYKFSLYDSNDNLIKTVDNITSFTNSSDIPESAFADQAQAEGGTNNTKLMTPLRTYQAIKTLGDDVNNFRLTLSSGNPVYDYEDTSIIYLTPFNGNKIKLYSNGRWEVVSSGEVSITLSGLTANLPYDVFAYNNDGVVTLEKVAWSTDTSRATQLTRQDGIFVKSGDPTRRYLGTFYATSTTQTCDTYYRRYLWNAYNRVRRYGVATDSTTSWNYSTASWRQANGASTNQVNFVIGLYGTLATARCYGLVINSTSNYRNVGVGIGLDSTTSNSAPVVSHANITNARACNCTAEYAGYPSSGRHYLAWLEIGAGTETQTWYGTYMVSKSGLIMEFES